MIVPEYLHFLVLASAPLTTIYTSYYNFCLLRLFVIEKLDNFFFSSVCSFCPFPPNLVSSLVNNLILSFDRQEVLKFKDHFAWSFIEY